MNENRNQISEGRGIGVGYVTLIMLFAVICLTVLASLSYEAARANDKLNEKSIYFTSWYYLADSSVNEVLSVLDEAAYEAHETGFFADSFEAIYNEKISISLMTDKVFPDNAVIKRVQEGFMVSYSCPVTDNLELSAEFLFFDVPRDGQRYEIRKWKTVAVTDETNEGSLGVWDGSLPTQN